MSSVTTTPSDSTAASSVATVDGDWQLMEASSSQITLERAVDGRVTGTIPDGSGSCGWWILKPRWLQKFLYPQWVLFWLCWAGALQGMLVNGFVNVVITTIERRFNLRSTETGMIAGAYDIASFLCLVPVSYFGGNGSKPRWLGWGLVIMGVGSILFAVPHFTTGLYAFQAESEVAACHPNRMAPNLCTSSAADLSNYKYVFITAQLLHGVGAAPLFTLGVTFLDENVSTKMSSIYIGIYYAMAVIGPAIGYLVGGQFLKIYTDFDQVDANSLTINPESNVWVGAWWIGFLISGVLSIVVAIPILGYPRELPGSQEIQAQKVSETHHGVSDGIEITNQVGFGTSIKDMPKSLKLLFVNPTFMFLNFGGAFEGLLLSGFAAFLPKFIESQFSLTASWAALLVGSVTVTSGGGGTFLGGYIIKRFQLRCAGIIKICIIFAFVSLCSCFVFFFSCSNVPFAGVNTQYYNSSSVTDLPHVESDCNGKCVCSLENYDPVCGVDNIMYYSPCYAGCMVSQHEAGNSWGFSNCSCIDPRLRVNNSLIMATREPCKSTCHTLPAFLGLTFVFGLFTFLASMPALSATLRCVADQQRSFALGIQWIIVRLLGSIPAPIIMGAIMDATCVLWQESCGKQGSCRSHDNLRMSRYVLAVAVTGKILSGSLFFLAWFFYKPPPPKACTFHVASISAVPKQSQGSGAEGERESPPPFRPPEHSPVALHQQHWPRVNLHTSAGL